MIHVLADQNLYKIKELIPPQVRLSLFNPSEGLPDTAGADALLVRTVSPINAETLPNPLSLTFVGTGSSGTDHIDFNYLKQKGIEVADAKGCNAQSVAEYVMTALLLWKEQNPDQHNFTNMGIIGVGKAGTAVSELLSKFGIECVEYDPPRAQRDPDFSSATMNEVLQCDMLTFHVPLNLSGKFATYHWLDEEKLADRSYNLVINAARGGVVDELALMKHFVEGDIENYILDVWENEPDFNSEVAKHAFIATPHIAGYSEQAKVAATRIICEKLADHFELSEQSVQFKTKPKTEELASNNYDIPRLLTRLHPILGYDKALRDLSDHPDKKILFRNLRNEWPYRYEYRFLKIRNELLREFEVLQKLGIKGV